MDIYIDTEFNGFGGELISMALVTASGHEWYEVLALPEKIEPWVAENVVPILDKGAITKEVFRFSLRRFLLQFGNVIVFADWHTDIVHFFESFAGNNHGEAFHFPCTAVLLANVPDDLPNELRHNALSDARSLRDLHVSATQ